MEASQIATNGAAAFTERSASFSFEIIHLDDFSITEGKESGNRSNNRESSSDATAPEKPKPKEESLLKKDFKAQFALDRAIMNQHGASQGDPLKTMQHVADEINKGGIGTFLQYVVSKDYGPEFFTQSIRSGPETRGSNSALVPSDVAFGLKTAAWGHRYFGANDEVRHMIGSFMVAENYGPISADMITTGNEFFGLITIDVPNWINGRSSSAFEFHDYINNQAGIMLWTAYTLAK